MIKEKFNKSIRGFTLIELLIVIAIIGVLATLLMVNFVGVRQRARDAQRKSDLRQIQSALEIWRSDNGSYPINTPTTQQFPTTCGTPASALVSGSTTYMAKLPCDPSTNTGYIYVSYGSSYSLYTCLENARDSQKDASNDPLAKCTGTSQSYTLNNP